MFEYIPTEEYEQVQVIQYLDSVGAKYTAIPNSTYTTSWKQKIKNKTMGLKAGFPDLIAIVDGTFIAIEMKRIKNSATSPKQKEWVESLQKAGIPTIIAKGADEAITFIRSFETTRGADNEQNF